MLPLSKQIQWLNTILYLWFWVHCSSTWISDSWLYIQLSSKRRKMAPVPLGKEKSFIVLNSPDWSSTKLVSSPRSVLYHFVNPTLRVKKPKIQKRHNLPLKSFKIQPRIYLWIGCSIRPCFLLNSQGPWKKCFLSCTVN